MQFKKYPLYIVPGDLPQLAEDTYNEPYSPEERRLWQSVIIQLLLDASRPKPAKREELNVATSQARAWFTSVENEDFHEVCDQAGYHPDTVRSFYSAVLASGKRFTRRRIIELWEQFDGNETRND